MRDGDEELLSRMRAQLRDGPELVDGQSHVVEPRLHQTGRELVAAGIAGPEEIEAQTSETRCRKAFGEMPIGPIRTSLVGANRAAEDHADAAPRALSRGVVEPEQRVPLGTEGDRLLSSGSGSNLNRFHALSSCDGRRHRTGGSGSGGAAGR